MSSQISFIARIQAKSGKEGKVKEELFKLIDPTRQEGGCISYDLHQSLSDCTQFLFYENWKSKKDIENHFATAHVKTAFANLEGSLAWEPDLSEWKKL